MIKNQTVASGLLFVAISLIFGITSLLYHPMGDFRTAGAGLIPAIVSFLLLMSGTSILIRGLTQEKTEITFRVKNLIIVMLSIVAFVVATKFVNMLLGITVLIFASTVAIPDYSIMRNAKIVSVLIIIAVIFKYWFGLDLPLL